MKKLISIDTLSDQRPYPTPVRRLERIRKSRRIWDYEVVCREQ